MYEQLPARGSGDENAAAPIEDQNKLPIVITIAVLGIMMTAIAIDASSMPLLSVLVVASLGLVIAAIAAWG